MATAAVERPQHDHLPVPAENPETHDLQLTANEAMQYDGVIRSYAEKERFGWWNLGEAAKTIRDLQLWKQFAPEFGEEPFAGMDDYLERRGQRSKSAIWLALKLRETLDAIGEEHCREMPRNNAIWISRFVQRVKKDPPKEMLAKAKTMKEKVFADYVNSKMPGAAQEEVKQSIIFSGCAKSLAKIVDEAITVAMWEAEVEDKRDALERICSHFLDSTCEHEGFKSLSNRQAFDKAQGRKKVKKH